MKTKKKHIPKPLSCSLTYFILIVFISSLIAGCGPQSVKAPVQTDPVEEKIKLADSLSKDGKHAVAAQLYWEMALESTSPQKEKFQLRAAELAWQSNELETTKTYQSAIASDKLDATGQLRLRILNARLAIADQQYRAALEWLPVSVINQIPAYNKVILQLRAQALAGSHQSLAAVRTYGQLLSIQEKPAARRFTEQALWRLLTNTSPQEMQRWQHQSTDSQLQGWIALAQIKKSRYLSAGQLSQALSTWRAQHPQHPASDDLMVSIVEEWESYFVMPQKIAVLLPMNGRFARLAEIIYAGILTAREAAGDTSFAPQISLYDTSDETASTLIYYNQAVRDGAEFVIGPLRKEAVNELASAQELPIPVLTLNYADSYVVPPVNLFQFGLLPEDEAMQVAERASLDNLHSAAVLVPQNEWGTRFVTAFNQRYTEVGGHVAQVAQYIPEDTDYSAPIKSLLKLDESETRYRQLRNLLNRSIEFEPKRREDIDFIFLVATPRNARLLKPQINYYYASDLPVYSTSHIFSGVENTSIDHDINGVVFCDIPWIVQPTVEHQLIEELLELRAGQSYELLPRFAALGIDALQVIPNLKQLAALPHERFNGVTGTLRVTEGNRIYRELNWAQFKNGRPERIEYQRPAHESWSE